MKVLLEFSVHDEQLQRNDRATVGNTHIYEAALRPLRQLRKRAGRPALTLSGVFNRWLSSCAQSNMFSL
jgi:hypothetical protein